MKEAIDNNGNVVNVSRDTLVKFRDGKAYLLTSSEESIINSAKTANAANLINILKENKIEDLDQYYNSDTVREVTRSGKKIKIREKALIGAALTRSHLVDNSSVNSIEWHYDDDSSETLNLGQLKQLSKFIVEEDARLKKLRKLHRDAINALTDESAVEKYDVKASIGGLNWI